MARGLPTGGQGSKVYVLCAEPKEHKHFRPGTRPGGSGTRPGGSVTGGDREIVYVPMFMCLFRPLKSRKVGRTCGVCLCVCMTRRIMRQYSDSVKRLLSRRHLSVLNFLFNFISMVGAPANKKLRFH